MGISPYPRFGQRIAPATLRGSLSIPLPKAYEEIGRPEGMTLLSDLAERAWATFASEDCYTLAQAVVNQVRSEILLRPADLLGLRLPELPLGTTLTDLHLSIRTHNALARHGLSINLERLGSHTVERLLKVRNFGAYALVDFLTSVESFIQEVQVQPRDVEAKQRQEVRQASLFNPEQFEIRADTVEQSQVLDELTVEVRQLHAIAAFTSVHSSDIRLGMLIQTIAPHVTTAQDMLDFALDPQKGVSKGAELVIKLRGLHEELARLHQLTLEEELHDILSRFVRRERDISVFTQYYGLDGQGGRTLQEIGDQLNLTRERVRQIRERVEKQLDARLTASAGSLFAPVLDQALSLVEQQVPASTGEVESLLVEMGITPRIFRIEGLRNLAELFGRSTRIAIEEVRGIRLVNTPGTHDLIKLIMTSARKTISRSGATTLADVAAQVTELYRSTVDEDAVAQVLSARDDFHWLDKKGGWFWLSSVSRNRLINTVNKIMSVAKRIEVSELRAGVSRHHRTKGSAPPRRVLLELCRSLPGYCVEGSKVMVSPPLEWRAILDTTEGTMVTVLEQYGPVMQRSEFERECLERGMNRETFIAYLVYSPVLQRYAREVYGLRGAQTTPSVIESLTPAQERKKVLKDYGWTSDGNIWIAYHLSRNTLLTGIVSIPSGMKQFVDGRFVLRVKDGLHIGELVVQDDAAWGLRPFFHRRGGEPGDYIVIVFDPSRRDAVVHIGDHELLDEFQG